MSDALGQLAGALGIAPGYRDTTGTWRDTPPETQAALLAAMGLPVATPAEAAQYLAERRAAEAARPLPAWVVVAAEEPVGLAIRGRAEWHLRAEDGTPYSGLAVDRLILPPLPAGYHDLRIGDTATLILAQPPRLPLPRRGWGVTLPLYGLRTRDQGGFGDYGDLERAVAGLGAAGADFVGINPIHAGFPTDPAAYSPYAPSSRQRLNILHLAVPGAGGARTRLIDYATDIPARMAALRSAFAGLTPAEATALEDWIADQGAGLDRFATHQALSDRLGPYWPDWPAAYRDPAAPAVAAFARAHAAAVRFHAWAQWMAHRQLDRVRAAADAAGMGQGLYLDLAVGTHPGGAETWAEPDIFARGVSLGAPPDAFAPDGQSWGIAPFRPQALVAARFAPLIATLRAQFRFARLLRIDHILGFERAFWVPEGGLPGGYVTMPKAALLAVIRIEAQRAGACVIGEDLGNVPEGLGADLDASGIMGCRLTMFEKTEAAPPVFRPGRCYDRDVLAAFATHDLPTIAGWRRGRDIAWRRRLGQIDRPAAAAALAERRAEVAALDALTGPGDDPDRVHRLLAGSRARLVAVQAEDVLGLVDQANLPGTIAEHPNWRRRLPVAADALGADPRMTRTARIMAGRPEETTGDPPCPDLPSD